MDQYSYRTIKAPAGGLYKEKGSRFIARAYPVESVEQCKEILSELKKEHYNARHHCYAYRIDPAEEQVRSNDDGEPSGTAGKPILNQIYSSELFNILIVVIRYFGGTKLGVSGLINAYKTSAREAISNADIIIKHPTEEIELHFDYALMNPVMRIIKDENLKVNGQFYDKNYVIKLTVKKNLMDRVALRFEKLRGVQLKLLKNN
ncbi:MAG: YigZ family protein [Chlorobi bacterium]|nr:YigZ family protein [Chlorobiota bacterium]